MLFDLGNVVVHFDNERTVANLARITGRPADVVREALYGYDIIPRLVWQYCHGDVTTDEYRALISQRLGLTDVLPESTFMEADADLFRPNHRVVGLILLLRRQGITVTAVSNIEPMRHRLLERQGIMSLFDHEVMSYQERLCKPSVELMVRALDRSGSMAENTIFVDDLVENLAPAQQIGINCHCYAAYSRLMEYLEQFNF
jgi:glucose-1-phosphatase